MPSLLEWIGALGAWLLFAGPVYQAALELDEEEVERDAIAEATAAVERPARVSPWWWLVPPVGYVLLRRRSQRFRSAAFAAMPLGLRRQFVSFTDKSAGWLLVAAGALLLAIAETSRLAEALEWPAAVTVLVCLVLAVLSASYTASRMRRRHRLLEEERGHPHRRRRASDAAR